MARNGDLSWSLRSAMGTEERAQREGGRQTRCTSLEIGKEVLAQSAMAAQDAEERTDDWRERPNTKAGRDEQGQQESGREAAARVESSRDARAARRSDRTERAQREGGDLHERAHDTILPEEDTTSRREERAQRGAGRGSRQVSGEAGVRGGEGAASAEGESEDGEREVGDNECGRNEGGRRERARARSSVRAAEEAGEPRARAAPRAVGGQNAVEDSNGEGFYQNSSPFLLTH